MVQLITENQTVVTARPSGTEPKIKFYFSVRKPAGSWSNAAEYNEVMEQLDAHIARLKSEMGVG
ncbi:MAG: hypothetical protein ACO2ZL_08850 [Flavobacteriales bacterium]